MKIMKRTSGVVLSVALLIGTMPFDGLDGKFLSDTLVVQAADSSVTMKQSNSQKVVIEDGVTDIGKMAYNWCTTMTSLEIPDTVTTIGEYAFNHCESLASVTIPSSVTTLGDGAFYCCYNLANVEISPNIKTLPWRSFSGCRNLTSVVIPSGVTSISNAFMDCDNLASVVIPTSVTTIDCAFLRCTKLKDIYYAGTKEQWNNINIVLSVHDDKCTMNHKTSSDIATTHYNAIDTATIHYNYGVSTTCTHSYGKWNVIKAATVLKKGSKIRNCSKCGNVETKSIEKLPPTIELSTKSKSLKVKKSFTLTISKMATGDSVKSVTASNRNVVEVKKTKTNQYKITAKKIGTSKITVLLNSGKKATCTVKTKNN